MNLREFIKQALCDIAGGIQDASNELGNETFPDRLYLGQYSSEFPNVAQIVDNSGAVTDDVAQLVGFEVCVTSSTEGEGKGKAGLKVMEFIQVGELNAEIKKTMEKSNQIRFLVPMRLGSVCKDSTQ